MPDREYHPPRIHRIPNVLAQAYGQTCTGGFDNAGGYCSPNGARASDGGTCDQGMAAENGTCQTGQTAEGGLCDNGQAAIGGTCENGLIAMG